ncbi:MAG: hypothetical protein GXO74_13540 [Calditrichaeota bacterium]|nr:hypothetical protein [Calditrichota bacterium]
MRKISLLLLILFLGFNSAVHSQIGLTGGKGMLRVLSADPIKPADIIVQWNISTYMKQASKTVLAKYYRSNLNVTVGLAHYLEAYLNVIPYQDDQEHLWGMRGDTQIGIKYLTPLRTNFFRFGLAGTFKIPTAGTPNVPFESFSTGKAAWTVTGLLTFDFLKVMPRHPIKINLNVGYMDHDVTDTYFTSQIDQMFVGAGLKFSIRSLQFFTEYSSEVFFNNPDLPYNQNSSRITQGLRFLGPWNNVIDVNFDIALTQYDSLKNTDIFHKEYYRWKVRVGITHRFSVYKYFDKSAKFQRMKEEEERRKLEAIKKKRQKVKQDLERMKKSLEEKGGAKKKKK